ncbi:biotin/lipoate--protein ligase family protein [Actibacterium lipolyticum]|uniref:Bifunctional ligase/repressor BirA n=1 Tax=Actibacterium lipolyticum TaxID=1524263 RepID=A0A238KNE4_9RHOB|nr:biotin/lipoate--protein ligase family protein [Actibacterium lipolyticum]SMX44353.1 Bifunctional ligase/repressor BirA [Actibacterium lipolyticum]
MSEGPNFPPLLTGEELTGTSDPFVKACTEATLGCDAGLVLYNLHPDRLETAIVLAPETPLEQAMAAFCAVGVGLQNALGALAPPEVAVHLDWSGTILVNGAACGQLSVAASTSEPGEAPDWLVVGLTLPLIPPSEDAPGDTPDQTALFLEGCADVDPVALLEAWSRHTLVWLTQLDDEKGRETLHREWRGLAWNMGEDVTLKTGETGTFLGVDENFGMLLRGADGQTQLIPLSERLKRN